MVLLFNHSDKKNSELFNYYRNIESQSKSKLAKNYLESSFKLQEQLVLSFYQKDNCNPSIFSTIFRRNFWPTGTYRILNRTWQYPKVSRVEKTINSGLYEMIEAQVDWCKKQPDFKLAFISRQKNTFLFSKMMNDLTSYNLQFTEGPKIWVCKGLDKDCYQQIIYHGDESILKEWWKPK